MNSPVRSCRSRVLSISLIALLLGFSAIVCSCRSSQPEPPASTGKAGTPAASEPAKDAVAQPGLSGDDLPPVLKTSWKGDLDQLVKRRAIRVLVPFRRPEFFYMNGKPAGVLMEAFREIESILNARYKTTAANRIVVVLLPTSVDKIRERMVGGYGDIAAGSISITDQNKAIADFTMPTMTGVSIIPVTGPGSPAINSIDDLSGKEVWVMPATRMKKDLQDLNARFATQGKAPAILRETDPVLEPGDVMELVNAGVYQIALSQSVQADFWAQVFDNIKVRKDIALAQDVELAWAIQKNTPQLKTFLDDFIKTHGIGTSFGNTVMRRYLKDAKYVKNATNKSEMEKFRATLPHFKKYSAQYNMNYLLLAAQGYQESGLDQSVKSHVGAVGIMQVMPSTAAGAPVKVNNIDQADNNIHAGTRLLHFLIEEHFNEPQLDTVNRMLFAMAAYNAGPAKIEKCRDLAEQMGYDRNKWFNNVEIAVAKVVGRETTQYVANVYKYYICYRLADDTLQRRQAVQKKAGKA